MTEIILVSPPDISTAELLFNEDETRQVYCFFWPDFSVAIKDLEITNERRILAQRPLIAALDSTYALGYMQTLLRVTLSRRAGFAGLVAMGRKLATSYIKRWWKHAKQNDLRNPRVAEAIRRDIARNWRSEFEMACQNAGARPRLHPFYATAEMTTYWG